MAPSHLHLPLPARTRAFRARSRASAGVGFTLLELMVVVLIIGIVAVLAMPSMSAAALDRHVYEDAASIQDLVREARARALGRGGSVMVSLSTKSSQGSFRMYEMRSDIDGGQNLPLTSCKAPSDWTAAANLHEVGDAMMNFSYEQSNKIKATIFGVDGVVLQEAFLCFTPGGRAFFSKTATFDADDAPLTGALRVAVAKYDSTGTNPVGIVRQVLIPPSGAARLVSGVP